MAKTNLNVVLSIVLCTTALIPVFQFATNYDALPDEIVSHYNVNMVADDTMSKIPFMITMVGMTLLMGVGTGFGSIFLIKRFPVLLNLPNKEYWLSKENRDATLSCFMLQIGIVTCLLFACIIQKVSNRLSTRKLVLVPGFGAQSHVFVFTLPD